MDTRDLEIFVSGIIQGLLSRANSGRELDDRIQTIPLTVDDGPTNEFYFTYPGLLKGRRYRVTITYDPEEETSK